MTDATLVYPHQLFSSHPALAKKRCVFVIEEPLILTHNPVHVQRLMLHKLSMDAYEKRLKNDGYTVQRLSLLDHSSTEAIFETLRHHQIDTVHVCDTVDDYLEQALGASGLNRVWYETPLFLLGKEEACARYVDAKRFMASFYKKLRVDHNILLNGDQSPVGGRWSFDEDNRKKLPKKIELPDDLTPVDDKLVSEAAAWANTVSAEQYGGHDFWLPYTHDSADSFLQAFLRERFATFGPYEDALTTRHTRLFHSALSPLMNVGLLTPQQVIEAALDYAAQNDTPLNSLEGFVRQILGWREFIRAAYECDGRQMRTQNFWGHTRVLRDTFWTGDTGVMPLDTSIQRALKYGYTHHIERLMVLGNFMLLTEIDPDDVYRWFMGLYVDAYDWVMVPNVYGMSQFADGGGFATKPYISGSNYLKKMSDYPKGEWEDVWTGLYWHFIHTHIEFFKSNHRLSMMPRLLEKMDAAKKARHFELAQAYLS